MISTNTRSEQENSYFINQLLRVYCRNQKLNTIGSHKKVETKIFLRDKKMSFLFKYCPFNNDFFSRLLITTMLSEVQNFASIKISAEFHISFGF